MKRPSGLPSATDEGLASRHRRKRDLPDHPKKKVVKERRYSRAARTGPYAYAQEVTRANGKVVTKYLGIVNVPEGEDVERPEGTRNGDNAGEPA